MKNKIAIVSTNRADIGLLDTILKKVSNEKSAVWHLVVSGSSAKKDSRSFYQKLGVSKVNIRFLPISIKNDSAIDITVAFQAALKAAMQLFQAERYNGVLITGDRFEMYAFALAAFLLKIPIFHLYAGEETLGAIDNAFRHSITLFADLHFCSTPHYAHRVRELKRDATSIFVVGSTSLESLNSIPMDTKVQFYKRIGLDRQGHLALVTYHPETLSKFPEKDIDTFISALSQLDIQFLVTASNVDEKGDLFNKKLKTFCLQNPSMRTFVPTLGKAGYFSALKYADIMIGNSSSGILEAVAFNLPVVNVGNRQAGRYQTANILNTESVQSRIVNSSRKALKNGKKKVKNPYILKTPASEVVVKEILIFLKKKG